MPAPLRILVDLDSTVTNFFAAWLPFVSIILERPVAIAEVTDYDPAKVWGLDVGRYAYEAMGRPGLYRDMDPLPGAVEGLRRLHEAGHELYVCSAYTEPHSAAEKIEWVREWLPFVEPGRVFTGREKHLLAPSFDAVLDDSPTVIASCRAANPCAWIGGIEYPYNVAVASKCDCLAASWRDTGAAWAKLVAGIEAFAELRRAA